MYSYEIINRSRHNIFIHTYSRMDPIPFICGGLACMTAETATFGVDTVKIRLQIQGQVIDESLRKLKYRGTLHAFWKITREEGFLALYSGLKPALFRQGVYGGLNIGLYHAFKHTLSGEQNFGPATQSPGPIKSPR